MCDCVYPGCSLSVRRANRHAVDEAAVLGTLRFVVNPVMFGDGPPGDPFPCDCGEVCIVPDHNRTVQDWYLRNTTDEEWGEHCERRGCEHTKGSHVTGTCDWCSCGRFLAPGFDDEAEERLSE